MNAIPSRAGRVLAVTASIVALAASGCAHQPPPVVPDVPGFFSGLLHGFLIVFSLVGSIFTDARIYAFPNAGFWYDAGFLVGASAFLGGGGHASRRRRAG
jgi:hypothetical protein